MAARRERRLISGIITVLTIFLLEAASVAAVFTDLPMGPLVELLLAFAFHLGAAVVVSYGFWGPWDFRYPEDKNWAAVGFVLVLAIPVYGLLGYAGAFAAVYWRRRLDLAHHEVIEAFEQYIAYEPEVEARMHEHMTLAAPTTGGELERTQAVAPLIDIIRHGTPNLRRGAIFSLSRLDRVSAVKILREALADADSETQFYVAGQLGRIEKELSDQIIRARRMLELDPDNGELKVRLARHCKDYVHSGLLEPSVERYFVRQAVQLLEEVRALDDERVDVTIDLGDLYRRRGDLDDAVTLYRRALEVEPHSTGARTGLAHCHFESRDLPSLRRVLDELKQAGDVPRELEDVVDFWDTPSLPSPGPAHA